MLRRKLLLFLGALVVLLVAVAGGAIGLLRAVLADMDHVKTKAIASLDDTNQLSIAMSNIEFNLYELQLGQERHMDRLIVAVDAMPEFVARLSGRDLMADKVAAAACSRIRDLIPLFKAEIGSLATVQDANLATVHAKQAAALSVALRQQALQLNHIAWAHARAEQESLTARFRWLVVALAIIFLLLINVAILVLLRMTQTILRPVGQLVEASRQLADEHFEHRVELSRHDEFDELARAFNHLAEQLEAGEKRKMETLQQVSLVLNHEVNNAVAIIELQLHVLGRQANGSAAFEKCLRQIRQGLERMTHTVEALKHVRRIVLTDYVSGVKMLDLQQSVKDSPATPPPEPENTAS